MTRTQYTRLLTACRGDADLAAAVWLACVDAPARAATLATGDDRKLRRLAWSVQRDADRSRWASRRRERAEPLHAAPPPSGFDAVAMAEGVASVSERAWALVARVELDGVSMAQLGAELGVSAPTACRMVASAREEIALALK